MFLITESRFLFLYINFHILNTRQMIVDMFLKRKLDLTNNQNTTPERRPGDRLLTLTLHVRISSNTYMQCYTELLKVIYLSEIELRNLFRCVNVFIKFVGFLFTDCQKIRRSGHIRSAMDS